MLLLTLLRGQDLTEGQDLLQNGQYHDAVKFFSSILQSYPENPAVLLFTTVEVVGTVGC